MMTISITHLTITEQTVLNVISDRSVAVLYVCFGGLLRIHVLAHVWIWLSWYCSREGIGGVGGGGGGGGV
jgi:hypothetical protein